MIRALLLDFDGTLVDSEPLHWEAWADTAAALGLEIDWQEYQRAFVGKHDRWASEEVLRRAGASPSGEKVAELWERKSRYYRTRSAERLIVTEALITVLDSIRRRDVKLALVTSSLRLDVKPALAAGGLEDLLDAAVFGEDVERPKPDPAAYLLAAERLGEAAEHCLAFEDSDSGVASAAAAGARVERVENPRALLVKLGSLASTMN